MPITIVEKFCLKKIVFWSVGWRLEIVDDNGIEVLITRAKPVLPCQPIQVFLILGKYFKGLPFVFPERDNRRSRHACLGGGHLMRLSAIFQP